MKTTCPHCGALMVEYRHGLSRGLVGCLRALRPHGLRAVDINTLGLTHSQLANFQKLRYWGFVEKPAEADEGDGNLWALTEFGLCFVEGRVTASSHVVTYRGEWVRFEGHKVSVSGAGAGRYKRRVDYLADAVSVGCEDLA